VTDACVLEVEAECFTPVFVSGDVADPILAQHAHETINGAAWIEWWPRALIQNAITRTPSAG